MIIKKIKIDEEHWTSQWIPISYKRILSKNQINKSLSYIWNVENELLAICRAYYINNKIIEIGDVWLNEKCRGKKINGEKISIIFMKKVINKIYKKYDNKMTLRLVVSKDNKSAIKLYEKLNFIVIKQVNKEKEKILGIKNGIIMSLAHII